MATPILSQPQTVVTQFDLKRHVSLSNQIDALKREHAELEQTLIASLSNGAEVEPGSHTAQLKTTQRRNVSWKNVVIRLKGSGYARNVLAHTKSTTYTKLVVR